MTVEIKDEVAEKIGFAVLTFDKFITLEDITNGTAEEERSFKNSFLTMCLMMIQEHYPQDVLSKVAVEDIQKYFDSLSDKKEIA